MMEKQPVTVSVITYNSSKYVLETLESIKAQTYPNLILHICDDCSTDNTIEICKKWIEGNKKRFISTDIIIPEHNTGVTANCNRAWDACTTEYEKAIAGDDILLPNCIEDNMSFVNKVPEAVFVFSKLIAFGGDSELCKTYNSPDNYNFFTLTATEQLQLLRSRNRLCAPSLFSNIRKLKEIGFRHDERIPMMEDYPKWIMALNMGLSFHFLNKETVKYRVLESSISNTSIPSRRYLESIRLTHLYHNVNYDADIDSVVHDILQTEKTLINNYIKAKSDLFELKQSKSYRLGQFLLWPFIKIKETTSK